MVAAFSLSQSILILIKSRNGGFSSQFLSIISQLITNCGDYVSLFAIFLPGIMAKLSLLTSPNY